MNDTRPLSKLERIWELLVREGRCWFPIGVKLKPEYTYQIVEGKIRQLETLAFMNKTIMANEGELIFTDLDSAIPLHSVDLDYSMTMSDVLTHAMSNFERFTFGSPLWHPVWYSTSGSNFLVVYFHHAIFDAKTASALVGELLGQSKIVDSVSEANLDWDVFPKEIENYLFPVSESSIQKIWEDKNIDTWIPYSLAQVEERSCKVQAFKITKSHVDLLSRFAKEHQLSLHHIIVSLFLKSAELTLQAPESSLLSILTSVDTRSKLKVRKQQPGCFVGSIRTCHDTTSESLVSIAKNYKNSFISRYKKHVDLAILHAPIDLAAMSNQITNYDRANTVEFSNMGAAIDSCKGLDIHVAQNTTMVGGLLWLNAIECDDSLNITLSWVEPYIERDVIQQFVDNIYDLVNEVTLLNQEPLITDCLALDTRYAETT